MTGLSLIVLRYLGWTFVVGDGPGVGPLETWKLDSQGHFTGMSPSLEQFGMDHGLYGWFLVMYSGFRQLMLVLTWPMDGNLTYGWSRSQGLSLIVLNNFGMDLG